MWRDKLGNGLKDYPCHATVHAYTATCSMFSDNEHMIEREKLILSLLHFCKTKYLALSPFSAV